MSKAVVLGGGGSVGTAWETGLIAGWSRSGIDLTDADLICGTSAGAAVGIQVALGHDLDAQLQRYDRARERVATGGSTQVLNIDLEEQKVYRHLFEMGSARGMTDKSVRTAICQAAVEATTMTEEQFLRTVKYLKDEAWPANFVCTTINVETAEFEVLRAGNGGDIQRGVAAAFAVPGAYPPITIGGQRYVDGGCLSPNHLHLAAGYEHILFVEVAPTQQWEYDAVASTGAQLMVIKPDDASVASFGDQGMMNAAAAFEACATGLAEGLSTADQVKAFWSD
jgi:NTE family protein